MTSTAAPTQARGWRIVRLALVLVTVAGLAIDAYVHFHLAHAYDPVRTSTLSQGDLFRIEGAVAAAAALLLLIRPRRWTAAIAAVVAGAGVLAVVLYRYWDIPRIGPIPAMYEARWYTEKTVSAIAEAVAFVAAVLLLFIPWGRPAPAGPARTE